MLLMLLMLLGGVTCVCGSLKLTTSPLPAVEGKTFSLFALNGKKATVVRWYRNGVLVLHMNHPNCSVVEGHESGLNGNIVGSQYTSRRVNASCAQYESSVTLLVDSSQVGSVWWLEDNNNTRSNNVTIEVARNMTSPTSMTSTKATSTPIPKSSSVTIEVARTATSPTSMTSATTSTTVHVTRPGSTDETGAAGQVYTVAGTTAGIIIIIAMVILICCFVKHRHTGQKSATNDDGANTLAVPVDTASYISLDHVDTTDNTYTQLKSGGHSETSEGSVYYSTMPTGGGHSDISQGNVHYNTVPTGGGHSDISEGSVYYNTVPTDADGPNPPQTIH